MAHTVTMRDIKEARKVVDELEDIYLSETPSCQTKECPFFRAKSSGNCCWSVLLEECKEYTTEETQI